MRSGWKANNPICELRPNLKCKIHLCKKEAAVWGVRMRRSDLRGGEDEEDEEEDEEDEEEVRPQRW